MLTSPLTTTRRRPLAVGCLAATLLMPVFPAPAQATFFELGEAAEISVLGLGRPSPDALGDDGRVDLANATVIGDVGVGPYGTLDFEGPALIDGDLYIDPLIKNYNTQNGTVTGTIFTNVDLSGVVDDVLDAAATYKALLPDQNFSKIDSSTVIYGNGGTNVIEIQSIELAGRETIRLLGGPDDVWILNVLGGFDLMNQSWISAVPPQNLLINLTGDGGSAAATTSTDSVVNGKILGAYRKIFLQGRSGAVLGGRSDEISLNSGAEVRSEAFPVFPEPNDLTGDGKGDLVLRNSDTGFVSMWEMDGNLPAPLDIGTLALDRQIIDIGDLNGDGKADIVLRNMTTGFVFMWEMDGNIRTYQNIGALPARREVVGIGDLGGDGKSDLVLRNTDTGFVFMWEMDGNLRTYLPIGAVSLDVDIIGIGDLTGDGKADIVLRNLVTGFVFMWEMDDNVRIYRGIGPLGSDIEIVGIGDLSGDGKADIVLRNLSTGFVFMWEMDGSQRSYHGIGTLGLDKSVVRIADLNDDDRADIVLRNDNTGFVFMWEMDGNVKTYRQIGNLSLSVEIQPSDAAVPVPSVTAVDDLVPYAQIDVAKAIEVLGNDSGSGALDVVAGSVTAPAYGLATLQPDNTIVYEHNSLVNESTGMSLYKFNCASCHSVTGFNGTDTFSYSATDGLTSDTATVTVKVKSFDVTATTNTPDLSGFPMTACEDIAFTHYTCRGLNDAEINAIGRFLGEVFP